MNAFSKICDHIGVGNAAMLPAYNKLANMPAGFPDSLRYEDIASIPMDDDVIVRVKRSIDVLCTVAGCSKTDLSFIGMDSTPDVVRDIVWSMSDAMKYINVYDSNMDNELQNSKARIRAFYNCLISAGTLLISITCSLSFRYIVVRTR